MHLIYISVIVVLFLVRKFEKKTFKKRIGKMNSELLELRQSKGFYQKKYNQLIEDL